MILFSVIDRQEIVIVGDGLCKCWLDGWKKTTGVGYLVQVERRVIAQDVERRIAEGGYVNLHGRRMTAGLGRLRSYCGETKRYLFQEGLLVVIRGHSAPQASEAGASRHDTPGYSLVVTDPTTNPALACFSIGDRTGSRILRRLWSYVTVAELRSAISSGYFAPVQTLKSFLCRRFAAGLPPRSLHFVIAIIYLHHDNRAFQKAESYPTLARVA
ncbi:hypothetical protein UVI_02041300 [Ustilaginoidea virens]|uniref:Uncharacterized protein n=1 Tax=Ustilaginoidea virens TaxID=1159556 RepID=A0A1B5KWI7_USTVR|nr:hypothetical protein UVI_02041300 [Ustilaginoidea virens]